ncbi:peptide chain release factor N(5)-glutamine methyltransferase [Cellulomonas bogoriensis]|uniref:Release factor glutamine methyltransferase n=1 Tax=Cellulomonas bogoriensis 69B4 = DSM 16987 TaxID=1386082 RepID=A0A0A0C0U3_9CELL|nr:peptide chain release factor N(5)-glutamine methyltransferase [Cellulomonas bogoriensis]KGM13780.1 SAM-dependent methyltransferase [Cellulomonas bogoriensis 69B4 = DSM 16987]
MTAAGLGHDHGRTATLRAAVRGAASLLAEAGVGSPDHDACALAAHVLGVDRLDLVLPPPLPADFTSRLAGLVERRCRREPLQHIVGHAFFRHVRLEVRPGVFVPRPETEVVAEVAVREALRVAARRVPVVVDLCCGAGGMAVSVAHEVPGSQVHAVDLSGEAVALTEDNARAVGVTVLTRVGDATDPRILSDVAGSVDVVVSNPPYIPPHAVPVDPEVRDHDPDLALYGGGPDGLAVPRGVVTAAGSLLRTGGLLVMEHAEVQATAVRELVAARGVFDDVETRDDLTGRPRMVVARRGGAS